MVQQVRNAFRVVRRLFAATALIALVHCLVALYTGWWQLWVVAGLALVYLAVCILSFMLIRRGYVEWGLHVLALSIPVIFLGCTSVIAGVGLILAVASIMLALVVGGRSVHSQSIGWVVGVALLSFANPLLDLVLPLNRLMVPDLHVYVPAVVGGLIFTLGILVVRRLGRYGLRVKLMIAFMAVSLIPIGVLFYLDERNVRATLTDNANQALLAAATQTAVSLDSFVSNNVNAIGTEAQLPVFIKYLSLPEEQRQGSQEEAEANSSLHALSRKDHVNISSYALLDRRGWTLLDTYTPDIGVDKSSRPYFQMALQSESPRASSVEFSQTGEAFLYFIGPVRDTAAGDIVGFLRVRYRAGILEQIIIQNGERAGRQSFAILLDENLLCLAHGNDPDLIFKSLATLDPARVAELQSARRLPFQSVNDLSSNLPVLEQALLNASERPYFSAYLSSTSKQLDSAAVAKLRTQPWFVIFVQPQAVFLSPVRAQSRAAMLLSLAIIGAAAIVATGTIRLLTGPIVRLTSVARQITHGDLNARADVEADDETGALAAAFNSMTAQLRQTLEGLREHVAELKRTEQALRESEERYRGLFDGAPVGVYRTTPAGQFLDVNPALVHMFGYPDRDAMQTINAAELYAVPEAYVQWQMIIEREGAVRDFEAQMRRCDGALIWVRNSGRIVRDANGQALGYEGIWQDITESRRAEIERQQLLADLHRRNTQLQAAAQVSKSAGTLLNPDELMSQAVHVIQERFDFYYVGIFLLDDAGEYAVLRVGTGEAGRNMLRAGHKLAVGGESMIGWSIAHAEARIALDVGKEAVRFDNPHLPRTRSEMALPLVSRGQVLGALTVQSEQESAFSREDIIVLQTMADQLAIAIENARLYQQAHRRASELAALVEIDRDISASLELQTVLERIATHALRLLDADDSEVYLQEADGQTLRAVVALGEYSDEIKAFPLRLGKGIVGCVAQSGVAEVVDSVEDDPRSVHIAGTPQETHALACTPLVSKDHVIGVMALVRLRERGSFNRGDLDFMMSLARQAVIAIENARLFEAERTARERAETLHAASQALSATLDLQQVFALILSELRKVLPYDSASVQQLDGDRLTIIGGHGFPNLEEIVGLSFDLAAGDNPNKHVVHTRAPLIVSDAPAWYSDFHREPHAQAGIRSWLGVPLLFGDRLIGMIALDKKEPGYYTQEHARLAMAFAAQAAIAIENARLYEAQRQQAQDLAAVNAVMRALGSSLEQNTLLRAVMRELHRLIAFDRASLALIGSNQQTFTLVALEDSGEPLFGKGVETRLQDSAASEDVLRGQMHATPDLSTEIQFPAERLLYQAGLRSRVNAPLIHAGRIIGALSVASRQASAFGQREIALLEQISGPLAIAIENARLYTEAQEHARELAEALSKLKELDRLKSEFIQNVSHELRTPLGIIMGYAELLDGGDLGGLSPDQRASAEIIARRTRMLKKLIDDLTAIMRTETQGVQGEPVDLAELVSSLLSDFQVVAQKAKLNLSANIEPALPLVSGDPGRLRQVLDNLLGNAIKFTPVGGAVAVHVQKEGEGVAIQVSDTGIGIPADKLERVFDRFYQVDGSMRRRYGGVGLGLALVKEIVQAHGGRVNVQSVQGEGSSFKIWLPCEVPGDADKSLIQA